MSIVKERPIIFNGEMVRALLAGTKTQTRRVIKPQPIDDTEGSGYWFWRKQMLDSHQMPDAMIRFCSYGQPGNDRLWVREAFQMAQPWGSVGDEWIGDDLMEVDGRLPKEKPENLGFWLNIYYRIDDSELCNWWRPSIFMPRWASRITLKIVKIRVERIQDISEEDAIAEGAPLDRVLGWGRVGMQSHREGFMNLWDHINDKRGYGWLTNPWVWVIEFKRLEAN